MGNTAKVSANTRTQEYTADSRIAVSPVTRIPLEDCAPMGSKKKFPQGERSADAFAPVKNIIDL
jgi:hypothetical protein